MEQFCSLKKDRQSSGVECPICGWKGEDFLPKYERQSVLCPNCGAFERHRHQFIVYKKLKLYKIIKGNKVLLISPKQCIARLFQDATLYVSMDLSLGKTHLVGDLMNLPFRRDSFKLVWCSHVLEHIRRVDIALLEIKRVLAHKGIGILDVPIYSDYTIKLNRRGRHGHIWKPGLDWYSFYLKAGFVVKLYPPEMCEEKYRVKTKGMVAVCRKP